VDVSRQKIRRQVIEEMNTFGLEPSADKLEEVVENRVRDEIRRGVQTIQYQVVTLMTTNGQAPFITVFMYLNEARNEQEKHDLAIIIEEMLRQRYEGVKNEEGVWITPAFPKLIYVLEEDNVTEDSAYFYLTKLAAKCTAKRMVPDYISEKKMRELKLSKGEVEGEGDTYTCMGCRSFLTPDRSGNGFNNVSRARNYEPGKPKYYGRFNQGVVTISLPDVALSSYGDMDKFWEIFEQRLELCHRALRCRHERLRGTLSDAAPILWQYGALARLDKGETIDKLLYGGYSTISLGYAGLYECVKYMTGHSHTDEEATPFALAVMQKMNDKCAEWKAAEDIDYSLYGTPLESTTYKFAKALQRRFGIIKGITDKGYITNSYHVHVSEEIDAFTKLKFESEFQRLSPGGAISYIEVPDMQDNLQAVIRVMQYIYDNIMYAELNTKSDYCQVCGFDGEIQVVEDDGKLVWECPSCGNRNQDKMNVARRTCGYIGTQYWNQGRTEEIKDRVLHL
jgi:ribonucleoside-triphosphate reductase